MARSASGTPTATTLRAGRAKAAPFGPARTQEEQDRVSLPARNNRRRSVRRRRMGLPAADGRRALHLRQPQARVLRYVPAEKRAEFLDGALYGLLKVQRL